MFSGLAGRQLGTTALTPDACWGVWDQTLGYIAQQEIAPVWIGEFGTPNGYKPSDNTPPEYYTDVNNVNPQGNWFSYLVQYIKDHNINWCYWALNGRSSRLLDATPASRTGTAFLIPPGNRPSQPADDEQAQHDSVTDGARHRLPVPVRQGRTPRVMVAGTLDAFGVGFVVGGLVYVLAISGLNQVLAREQTR